MAFDEMVLIPGGEFVMGDHHDSNSDALPLHEVKLGVFYISKYEITNRQYCDFLNSGISTGAIKIADGIVYDITDVERRFPFFDTHSFAAGSQIDYSGEVFSVRIKDGDVDMSDHPVVHVSWYGAAAFCNWRSAKEGLDGCYNLASWECDLTKNGYHLPTEAQWEYAARGGEYSPYYRFPLGDEMNGSMANYWSSGHAFEKGDFPWTTPVGYYDGNQEPEGGDMSNGYGIYDMDGNVQEWCNDWYASGYGSANLVSNPMGPSKGSFRVLRGGFWRGSGYLWHYCRNAFRYRDKPFYRYDSVGFRIAKPE